MSKLDFQLGRKDVLDHLEPQVLALTSERDRYREALASIAEPLGSGCGCGGPTCHCFSPESVRIELDERISLAQETLK